MKVSSKIYAVFTGDNLSYSLLFKLLESMTNDSIYHLRKLYADYSSDSKYYLAMLYLQVTS